MFGISDIRQQRSADETEQQWQVRLVLLKIDGEIDLDWSELGELFGVSGDHLRRMGKGVELYRNAYAGCVDKRPDIPGLDDIKIEKQKLTDQRREINEAYRAFSRDELIHETIMEAVRSIRPIEIKQIKHQRPVLELDREKTLLVGIADPHYGKLISVSGLHGEELNTYSPEIFESRMEQLLDNIRRLASFHRPHKIVIPNLGDSIDGMFRTGQLMAIRYGAIDSCILYSEYMANWLNEVSEIAPVDYFHVCGNHDAHRPVVNKKGEFPKENFGKIMAWWMTERLSGNDRVKISLIEKIGMIDVCGNNILLIHGDGESKSSEAAKQYSFLYNVSVDLVMRGHLHTYSDVGVGTNEEGVDIREIYVPSICGVDEFAMSIKRRSSAGAVAMLLERKEDRIVFPIRLK